MGTARAAAKRALYSTGALGVLNRRRNGGVLTVVTLHRVLRADDGRRGAADPRYTIDAGVLAAFLRFLRRHYEPVGLSAVLAAAEGGPRLPDRPVLVTIDDGWLDTVDTALPVLREARVPAVVFVTSGYVGAERPFWQPRLIAASQTGSLAADDLAALWAAGGAEAVPPPSWDAAAVHALIRRLGALPRAERDALLRDVGWDDDGPAAMMAPADLRTLEGGGVAIGAHGVTHEPIPSSDDPRAELIEPRRVLAQAIGGPADHVATMSFPHGAIDGASIEMAHAAGYRLVFTNDTCLNPLDEGRVVSRRIGRISIPEAAITDAGGRFRPELAALWLFRRPRRRLDDLAPPTAPATPAPGGAGVRIAVVIPTYNRADLVRRAVESALAQSRPPDEIVVVDDGSTDGTPDVVRGLGDRVTYVRQANGGVSAARNAGVLAAGCPWIAFLDSDDVWLEDHLARIDRAIAETSGAATVYFADARYADRRDGPTLWDMCGFAPGEGHRLAADATPWALMPRQPMLFPAIVVRRDDYLACGSSNLRLPRRGDTHLLFKLTLGRAACSVAGVGAEVTDDDPGGRLTSAFPAEGRVYWECSAILYDDLLRDPRSASPAARAALRRRLAASHWRLARLHWDEGRRVAALPAVARSIRADWRTVRDRLGRRDGDRAPATPPTPTRPSVPS